MSEKTNVRSIAFTGLLAAMVLIFTYTLKFSVGGTLGYAHFCATKEQWCESYNFYPKNRYVEYESYYIKKNGN